MSVPTARRGLWLARTCYLWLGLVTLFTTGRAFYLFDYRKVLAAEPYAVTELLAVFASSWRFDGSVAAYLLSPLILLALAGGWRRPFVILGSVVFGVSWIMVVIDHYFYLYFKDHFNVFFWEFFENPSNAGLVIAGLGDVVPMPLAVTIMAAGVAASVAFVRWAAGLSSPPFRVPLLVWLVLFAVAARGTLDHRPLSLQDRRIVISRNALINLLHTNPFLPLFRGYKDRREVDDLARSFDLSEERAAAAFARVVALIPGAKAEVSPNGYHYLTQHLTPIGAAYLQRQPQHVVVMFMESLASWIPAYAEGGFNEAMAPGLLELKRRGLSFAHHFAPAGGTIKNIAAANMSIPTARDFYPSIVYHKEGYKAFPGRLPVVMSQLGYLPRFFYGGTVAWHRLYQFLPAIGYTSVFAEHSFPDLPHHENGLYDGGTFTAVLDDLEKASGKTFTFVMSLTNHPPFDVPLGAENPPITVPPSLAAKVLDNPDAFMRRLIAYRYADRSLKIFIDQLEARGLAKDTLVVITGDHAFTSGIGFATEDSWQVEEVPLLFYGPSLLKPEFVGQSRSPFTTHLDLMPSLASLLTEAPLDVTTFGRSVFAEGPGDSGINHYFTCRQGTCLKDGRLHTLTSDFKFTESILPDVAARQSAIQADESAYYDAAMHYLFKFQP